MRQLNLDQVRSLIKVIACGRPEEIRNHPEVKRAYLGDEVGDEIAAGAIA